MAVSLSRRAQVQLARTNWVIDTDVDSRVAHSNCAAPTCTEGSAFETHLPLTLLEQKAHMEGFSHLFQRSSYEFPHFEFSARAERSLDCQNVDALRLSTYSRHVKKKKKIQLSNRAE